MTESVTRSAIDKLMPMLERQQKRQKWANDDIFYVGHESSDIENQDTSASNTGNIAKCLVGWDIVTNQRDNLRFSYSQHSKQWTKSFTNDSMTSIDEIIGFSHANSISKKYIWDILNCRHEPQRDIEEELELDVVMRYLLLPQVMLIYTDEYQDRKRFLIFTSNTMLSISEMGHF